MSPELTVEISNMSPELMASRRTGHYTQLRNSGDAYCVSSTPRAVLPRETMRIVSPRIELPARSIGHRAALLFGYT